MPETMVFPVTPDGLCQIIQLLDRTDPPNANWNALVNRAISLFCFVVDETTPPKRAELTCTLFNEPGTYRRFNLPLLGSRQRESGLVDVARPKLETTLELTLPNVTWSQMRRIIKRTPELPTWGHVISSSLSLFESFVELAEPPEPKGKFLLHYPERKEFEGIKFPFWRSPT